MHQGNNPPQKPGNSGLKITDFNYWLVTIEAFLLTIFIYYFTRQRQNDGHRHLNLDYEEDVDGMCPYDQDDEGFFDNFYGNLLTLVRVGAGVSLVGTAALNGILGRRPSNDHHHDPLYHKIIQGAGNVLPTALAIGHSLINFASKTIFGDRAAEANRVVSEVLSAFSFAQRAVDKADELYDHAMDRSTALDGNVRRIEYTAIRLENAIVYIVEAAAHAGFVMMDLGVTRFTINDQNRLYVIAGIYHMADVIEAALILPVNEYAYYAEQIADLYLVSYLLRLLRIADPSHPVKAVNPKKIDKIDDKLKEHVSKVAGIIDDGVEEVSDAISNVIQDIGDLFNHNAEEEVGLEAIVDEHPAIAPIVIEAVDGHYSLSFPEGLESYQYNFPSFLPHSFSITMSDISPVGTHFEVLLPNGYSIEFKITANRYSGGQLGRIKYNAKNIQEGYLKSYKLSDCLLLSFRKAMASEHHDQSGNHVEARIHDKQNARVKKYKKASDQDVDRKMTPEELEEHERQEQGGKDGGILDVIKHALAGDIGHTDAVAKASTNSDGTHNIDLSAAPAESEFQLSATGLPENLTFFIPVDAESGFHLGLNLAQVAHLAVNVIDEDHVHHAGAFGGLTEDRTELADGIHSYIVRDGVLVKFDAQIIGGSNYIELFIKFIE